MDIDKHKFGIKTTVNVLTNKENLIHACNYTLQGGTNIKRQVPSGNILLDLCFKLNIIKK